MLASSARTQPTASSPDPDTVIARCQIHDMGATYLPPLIPTDVVRPLKALTTSLKPGIRDLYFVVHSTTLSVVELGIDNVRVTRPFSIDDLLQGLPWNRHASAGLIDYFASE
ncbi:hypothetical protein L210DRAFT_82663 [Boletus edulis BED1]|uniref:Uncharacterized protein n=1 Tax=Boletus edulis BED1 TaxID=1328754 RepID=A0AAD4C967_BOLED|nr:hypothetical protein L210DRAFT_82663 [Boletus edulis BED1]